MTHALMASLIYSPLRPLLRLWRVVVYFLRNFDVLLEAQFDRYAYTAAGRKELEAAIAFGEDGINLMIYARTCELLGIVPVIKRGPVFQEAASPRPIAELMARHARMIDLLRTFEHRAQQRAMRIRREIEQNPLRLDASHQSTSPMLCMVEDAVVMLEVLHRRRRGRWIARPSAQDGGGERLRRRRDLIQWIKSRSERLSVSEGWVLPRGPPQTLTADCPFPIASNATRSRSHPHTQTARLSPGRCYFQILEA